MSDAQLLLSLVIFLPALATLVIALLPKDRDDLIRGFTLLVTIVTMGITLRMAWPGSDWSFDISQSAMQKVSIANWIPSFNIEYFLGLDGISFPLVVLTAVISMFAMIASWSVTKQVKGYCILFLLLETGMLGVFMALDFFLFYVFWEVMLLPMYFLIGVWGGPRKEYAAIKFFLFTLAGSVLMLIAILMLYFNSDLKQLSPEQLLRAHVSAASASAELPADASSSDIASELQKHEGAVHTFNMMAMAQMGQSTSLFDEEMLFGWSLQRWAFILLFIGFIIKVPSVPLHTWLPDAHVEAPTPISMILAGVLLKMGGYGIIRICYPICPQAGFDLAWVVCGVGVVSMVYGAFAALAQTDFKRLVAYSSVSHMGYVVLGLGVWTLAADSRLMTALPGWADYWNMGVKGAMFQMIGHGVSSAGMFFMVGVVYDRVHHRNLDQFGGLFGRMPLYTALAVGIFFAGLGLPGLCGFIGEVLVVLSVWNFSKALAVISAFVVIITAGYILWAIQRVYLGPIYKGPHGEALKPITLRELCVAVPLLVLAIWFGVYPMAVFRYMDKSIDAQVAQLADWSEGYAQLKDAAAEEETAQADESRPETIRPASAEPAIDDSFDGIQTSQHKTEYETGEYQTARGPTITWATHAAEINTSHK
jgi:NADH-quinone oxidoreductase subunit M